MITGSVITGTSATAAAPATDAGWTPPAGWPDIKTILEQDIPPAGYRKLAIALISDTRRSHNLSYFGGSLYRTFDGYTGPTQYSYAWDRSKMVPCAEGYRTGWIIIYGEAESRDLDLYFCGANCQEMLWLYVDDAHITRMVFGRSGPVSSGCANMQCFETSLRTTAAPTSMGGSMFSYGRQLRKCILPDGPTTMKGYTFRYCHRLSQLRLPATLATLGTSEFLDCRSLKGVTLPVGVKAVTASLFEGCSSLEEVRLEGPVATYGVAAFRGTTALRRFVFPVGPPSLPESLFDGSGLQALELPAQTVTCAASSLDNLPSLTRLTVPEGWAPAASFSLAANYALCADDLVEFFFRRLGAKQVAATISIDLWATLWNQLSASDKALVAGKGYAVNAVTA